MLLRRAAARSSSRVHARYASLLAPRPGERPLDVFRAAVQSGKLNEDPCQVAALEQLNRLHLELEVYEPPPPPPPPPPPEKKQWKGAQMDEYGEPIGGGALYTGVANDKGDDGLFASISSTFGSMFGGGGDDKKRRGGGSADEADLSLVKAPRGLYMYGGVGCGKSLLMDTFFDCSTIPAERKRRIHFHEFMQEMHKRMHVFEREHPEYGDPLPWIAHDISTTTSLLCFDEFQVTDVADALVMRRLFHKLFAAGLVMVATSNRPPSQLYLNGIQRQSFVPFIGDLERRCACHDLASTTDYRILAQVSKGARVYATPLDDATRQHIDDLFTDLASPGGHGVSPQTLKIGGRVLTVPLAGKSAKVARFTFDDLCGKPLGPADYLGIATTFHTVFLTDVPRLALNDINQVRRLITLVDALYDKHVKLVVSAAASPEEIFDPHDGAKAKSAGDGTHGDLIGSAAYVQDAKDEVFAFDRTVSRLNEMQSHEYLIRQRRGSEQHGAYVEGELDEPLLLYETSSDLSRDEALQLFKAYDVDASGSLEPPEVKLLLEDLCERRAGHRNVPESVLAEALTMMDTDGNGEVSQFEFLDYFASTKAASLKVLSWGGAPAAPAAPDAEPRGRGSTRPAGMRSGRVSRNAAVPE